MNGQAVNREWQSGVAALEEAAAGQAQGLRPIPGPGSQTAAAAGQLHIVEILLVKIAEDRLGPLAAPKRRRQQPLGEPRRPLRRGHDSSLPSRPCHNRSRLRLDVRIAAMPVAVTVK